EASAGSRRATGEPAPRVIASGVIPSRACSRRVGAAGARPRPWGGAGPGSGGDGRALPRGLRHGVPDHADQDLLDRLAVPRVAHQQRDVVVEVEGLPDVLGRVTVVALEAVDPDHEGDGAALEVVDGRETVLQPPRVGEHGGAEGALGQFVPHEPEPLLTGRAEEVQHEVLAQREAADVHGRGGGVLRLHPADVVDPTSRLGEPFPGAERPDLAHDADDRGPAHSDAAGHSDLDRDGLDRALPALGTSEDHRLSLLLDGADGGPYPPPPGVSMTRTSPGRTSAESLPARRTTVPSARSIRLAPGAPGSPPAIPYGGTRRCWDRVETVMGSRKRIRRTAPSPPGHRPAPPLPVRTANSSRRTGSRHSSTSGSVRRELVMWVCTTEAPGKPSPAPDPEATVS